MKNESYLRASLYRIGDQAKFDEYTQSIRDQYTDNIKTVTDSLYLVTIPGDKSLPYLDEYNESSNRGSVFRNGNFVGKNNDGWYDYTTNIIYKTEACEGRHASVAIASPQEDVSCYNGLSGLLSNGMIMSPYMLTDGINDQGLVISKVFTGVGLSSDIPVVREVLNKCSTVDDAIKLIKSITIIDESYLIADLTKTVVITPNAVLYDSNAKTRQTYGWSVGKVALTNFDLNPTHIVDGYMQRADSEYKYSPSNLSNMSRGVERYNIILDGIKSAPTVDSSWALLKNLEYQNCATDKRYTDFDVKGYIYSSPDHYDEVIKNYTDAYSKGRSLDGLVRETSNSILFNIEEKSMEVRQTSQDRTNNPIKIKL